MLLLLLLFVFIDINCECKCASLIMRHERCIHRTLVLKASLIVLNEMHTVPWLDAPLVLSFSSSDGRKAQPIGGHAALTGSLWQLR